MIQIDAERGKNFGISILNAYRSTGIHGNTEMPESAPPDGLWIDSLDLLFYITLTESIDYQRNATVLWESIRKSFNDPSTNYLFYRKKAII
ncbi:MAG: hypothetical protein ACXAB2_06605 [Candidatus Hodarchaeales archaeon]|jgi:hypothetical protein